jgi:hypothetical protein
MFSWFIVDGGPLDGALLPVPDKFLDIEEVRETNRVVIPVAQGVTPGEGESSGRRVLSGHLYKVGQGKLTWDGPTLIEENDGDRLAMMLTIVNSYRKESYESG